MRLAISTCPNDTFAFHAILEKRIDFGGLEFEIELLDIQQLNDGLLNDQFDVAKASFHAALLLHDKTVVLPAGSALGFGVGPLLLAARNSSPPESWSSEAPSRTLCPGQHTTAAMLFQLFHGAAIAEQKTIMEHALFSEIMPALQQGQADFGVCIHEGRFTWRQQGLHCVEDLGTTWELATGCPLPLGGILASRSLGSNALDAVSDLIRRSIEYAMSHREETLTTMRRYAQEFDDDVLFQHVDLYVNQWTVDLGEVGRQALQELSARAINAGLIEQGGIEVWGASATT